MSVHRARLCFIVAAQQEWHGSCTKELLAEECGGANLLPVILGGDEEEVTRQQEGRYGSVKRKISTGFPSQKPRHNFI